jgi:mycothiol synthase
LGARRSLALDLTVAADFEIVPFDVDAADKDALDSYYQLRVAVAAVDRPREPPLTYETVVGRLRTPLSGHEASHLWTARRAARIVGFGAAGFPEDENDHIGRVDVVVHPDARRQGIGTALLRAALPVVRANGRPVVEGAVLKDGPGQAWGDALGFRTVHETVLQELLLAAADRSGWQVPAPAGYHLRWWTGTTPPDLLTSYAAARTAIGDAPHGESSEQPPQWTVDRVRAVEEDLRQRRV